MSWNLFQTWQLRVLGTPHSRCRDCRWFCTCWWFHRGRPPTHSLPAEVGPLHGAHFQAVPVPPALQHPRPVPPQPPPGLSWAHADLCLGVDRPPSLSGSRSLPHLCTSQKMQAMLSAVWLANSARILPNGANTFSTSRRVSFRGRDSVSCSPGPLLDSKLKARLF